MLRTVKVSVLVYTLPDGGERVIPSMQQLKRGERLAQNQLNDTEEEIEASEIEAERALLRQNTKFLRQALRRLRRDMAAQPALEKQCKQVCYPINIPTYPELLQFESASRTGEEDMPRYDAQKLMDAVLPTLFVEEAPGDPQHIKACWERWREEAYPNDAELPFLD